MFVFRNNRSKKALRPFDRKRSFVQRKSKICFYSGLVLLFTYLNKGKLN